MLPSEAAAVSLLAREVFIQFVAAQYEAEGVEEFGRYESAEAFSQRQEPDHVSLVAEQDGELIGMLQLRESSHVAMLFIRPSCQRQGIGRALLAAASALVGDPDRAFTVSAFLTRGCDLGCNVPYTLHSNVRQRFLFRQRHFG
jgi:GNAT superfamily N-acetyltransferase